MEKLKVGPKDFFLWAGAMIAFYVSVFSFISLFFSYIDTAFSDPLNYSYDPYSSGMRSAIASLIVLFPLFLLLMRLIRKDIQAEPRKSELWVRRWALVFTVFVAGFTITGDLVTLINYFLGGDLTTRFVFKVLVVLLVASGGLMHFLADIWGYWIDHSRYARTIGWATCLLIVVSIAAGFLIMGTPGQIRLYRFDDQKVSDLQSIQYNVITYWQQHGTLPSSLTDLADPMSGYVVPLDPQNGESYSYSAKGPFTFELCATFNALTQNDSPNMPRMNAVPVNSSGGEGVDLGTLGWLHTEGENCFVRTIDPARYPPADKTAATPGAVPAIPAALVK